MLGNVVDNVLTTALLSFTLLSSPDANVMVLLGALRATVYRVLGL